MLFHDVQNLITKIKISSHISNITQNAFEFTNFTVILYCFECLIESIIIYIQFKANKEKLQNIRKSIKEIHLKFFLLFHLMNQAHLMKDSKACFQKYELLYTINHPNIIKTYGFFIGHNVNAPSIMLAVRI